MWGYWQSSGSKLAGTFVQEARKKLSLFMVTDWASPSGRSFSSDAAPEAAGLGDGVTREEIETVSQNETQFSLPGCPVKSSWRFLCTCFVSLYLGLVWLLLH